MKKIRILRYYYGLSKKQLASLAGINERTVEQYEQGVRTPYFKTLVALSSVLQFSVDYLIHNTTNYPSNLRLISLASQFDTDKMYHQRNQIEADALAFLERIKEKTSDITMDHISSKLTDSFHDNLKTVRTAKNISQAQLARSLDFSSQVIYMYEKDRLPPVDKLKKIAETLNTSAHCLCTGNKLHYEFSDPKFCKTMLFADHYLPLEEHKMLIHLMETLLENAGIDPQKPQHVLSKT